MLCPSPKTYTTVSVSDVCLHSNHESLPDSIFVISDGARPPVSHLESTSGINVHPRTKSWRSQPGALGTYHIHQRAPPIPLGPQDQPSSVRPRFAPDGGRVGLCLSCLVSLTLMMNGVAGSLPAVGYMKGIDLWFLVCIALVCVVPFLSLPARTRSRRSPQNGQKQQQLL